MVGWGRLDKLAQSSIQSDDTEGTKGSRPMPIERQTLPSFFLFVVSPSLRLAVRGTLSTSPGRGEAETRTEARGGTGLVAGLARRREN